LRGLSAALRRHHRVGIDTNVFIYQFEDHAKYGTLTEHVFEWLERLGNSGVTSTITMAELLVAPYRDRNQQQVDLFYSVISTYPNLMWVPTTLAIADEAARVRAEFGLKTADALQAATTLLSGATGFVTNDAAFMRVGGFEAIVLESWL
jgi:predicted nucleic acid-binding protein